MIHSSVATHAPIDTLKFSIYALKPNQIAVSNLDKLMTLLQTVSPTLTAKHIPELLFLKKKLATLNGCSKRLSEILDARLLQLKTEKQPSDEDDLVEQLAILSLENISRQEPLIIKLLLEHLEVQRKKPKELSPLTVVAAPLLATGNRNTSWLAFVRALRVSELFFPTSSSSDRPYELELRNDLEANGVDAEALFRAFKRQTDAQHLQSISPFLRICVSFLKKVPCDDIQMLVYQLQGILWQELLCEQSGTYMLQFVQNRCSYHEVHFVPLNLAIIINDLFLALTLISSGIDVNRKDNHGYCPAHIAALFCNAHALMLLKRLGADFTLPNTTGATVYDILKALGFRIKEQPCQVTLLADQPLPQAAFEALYRKKYSMHSLFSRDCLFSFWLKKVPQSDVQNLGPIERHVFDQYVKRQTNPSLALYKKNNDFVWRATKEIQPGEFLFNMTGKLTTVDEIVDIACSERAFQLDNGTCVTFRELGSCAEHIEQGPPSACFIPLVLKGQMHILIYAIRKIAKDEPIFMNFGRAAHYVESHPHILDQFIVDSIGLTYFPFKVSREGSKWLLETSTVCKDKIQMQTKILHNFTQNNLRLALLQAQYTRAMMEYLFEFPEYPLELIKAKKLTPGTFFNFLEALKASRIPKLHNDEHHRHVVIKILQAYYQLPDNLLKTT